MHLSFFTVQLIVVYPPGELEKRVNKLKEMLEKIKGKREYYELLPQIEEIQKRATKFCFQPATNVVIVGEN